MPVVSLNVPHFKQEFPYSCVPACVRMVLSFHGHDCTEEDLRQLLGTGPHGTPARALFLVESLGFKVRLDTSHLADLGTTLGAGVPPIVFLDTQHLDYWQSACNHVAVLVGLDLATVFLNDPYCESAPQQTALAGFQSAWAANDHLAAFIRRA